MSNWIKKLKSPKKQGGFTLVELLVAITILLTALLGIEMSVMAGLAKLKDQEINRGAAECARIMMEYFSTIPPDNVYEEHADDGNEGEWAVSYFSGGAYPALNAFVWNSNSACRLYSDASTDIGKKVNMRYAICPGCVTHTEEEPETFVKWTTCSYTIKLKITYDSMMFGGIRDVEYAHKFYASDPDRCVDICGESTPGEDKVLECPDV